MCECVWVCVRVWAVYERADGVCVCVCVANSIIANIDTTKTAHKKNGKEFQLEKQFFFWKAFTGTSLTNFENSKTGIAVFPEE